MIKLFVLVTILGFSAPCFAANEVYADGAECEKKTVELTNNAQKTIDIAVFSINRRPIINALLKAQARGVKIRFLTDRTQIAASKDPAHVEDLMDAGVDVRVHTRRALMHVKMAVFDGRTVSGGSFNWTNSAVARNYEICTFFVDDPDYAAEHEKIFEQLWEENNEERSEDWLRSRGRCGRMPFLRS